MQKSECRMQNERQNGNSHLRFNGSE